MADVTLRAMTDAEFTTWFARSGEGYADDHVQAFGRTREEADAEVGRGFGGDASRRARDRGQRLLPCRRDGR